MLRSPQEPFHPLAIGTTSCKKALAIAQPLFCTNKPENVNSNDMTVMMAERERSSEEVKKKTMMLRNKRSREKYRTGALFALGVAATGILREDDMSTQ